MKLCGNCKNRGKKSRCDLYTEVSNYAEKCKDFEEKKPTNADRIRSMSDEELAKGNIYFVSALRAKEGFHYTGLDGHYYKKAEEVVEANMKWLQSEVEE